jgi:glycosyltransferase involved in cell wall biosynthesis
LKVLIVHRYFWPEDCAAEEPLMLKDYVKWHTERGDDVDVVCGAKFEHQDEWKSEFDANVTIKNFIANVDRESTFTKRIVNSFYVLVIALKSIALNNRYDLIYVFSGPPLVALFINLINKILFKKTKILFSIQDNVIYRIKNPLLKYFFKLYIKITITLSDMVLVLSSPMKDEVLSYFKKDISNKISNKIHILVNFCSDLDKNKLSFSEKKTIDILYAGNHGPSQGLSNFIDVIAKIDQEKRPSIHFYGEGTDKKRLIAYSKLNNVQIHFNNSIPRRDIKKIMSISKFGLVSMSESLSKYAFPSKLAAYLSSGAQVIISSNGYDPLSSYVYKYNFGYQIDSSKPLNSSKKLIDILQCKDVIAEEEIKQDTINQFNKVQYFQELNNIITNNFK